MLVCTHHVCFFVCMFFVVVFSLEIFINCDQFLPRCDLHGWLATQKSTILLPRFEWQASISQSACRDETHHSFDRQCYLTVQNQFLSANSGSEEASLIIHQWGRGRAFKANLTFHRNCLFDIFCGFKQTKKIAKLLPKWHFKAPSVKFSELCCA